MPNILLSFFDRQAFWCHGGRYCLEFGHKRGIAL
jgi:hypothetical protein